MPSLSVAVELGQPLHEPCSRARRRRRGNRRRARRRRPARRRGGSLRRARAGCASRSRRPAARSRLRRRGRALGSPLAANSLIASTSDCARAGHSTLGLLGHRDEVRGQEDARDAVDREEARASGDTSAATGVSKCALRPPSSSADDSTHFTLFGFGVRSARMRKSSGSKRISASSALQLRTRARPRQDRITRRHPSGARRRAPSSR